MWGTPKGTLCRYGLTLLDGMRKILHRDEEKGGGGGDAEGEGEGDVSFTTTTVKLRRTLVKSSVGAPEASAMLSGSTMKEHLMPGGWEKTNEAR